MLNQFNSNQMRADKQRRQDAERTARQNRRQDVERSARRTARSTSTFARIVSLFL